MKKSTNLTTGLATDAVKDALRSSYNLEATPRLVVDWNYNRYTTPVAINNAPDPDIHFDNERFPIESIIEPLRPNKGAPKALVNQSFVSRGYLRYNDPKFYVSDTKDIYKYWVSPTTTDATGAFTTNTRPKVSYDRVVQTNKIVIRVENTWATPKNYSVVIQKAVGGATSTIGGTNPAIDAKSGTITLYYNGTAWVSTRPATLVTTAVASIELSVTSMGPGINRDGKIVLYSQRGDSRQWIATTGANSSLHLIAIEAHFEADLSERLMSVSDTFDMAESSQLYPIGTLTTNTGSLVLSNEDGIFNPENLASPYVGLIEPNAEVNLEYIYTIAGTRHSVQQFKMYISGWSSSEGQTNVSLDDYSKYLKEIKPNPFMIENKTSTEIVWRVLDSVGFLDYRIQEDDVVENTTIPVFWTDGEKTVWETLDELAQATQTAIYIDRDGAVQVRTREAAFRDDAGIDWSLLGQSEGTSLPDIISWTPTGEYEANKIEVKYKNTKWKVNSEGKPAMSKVWEPEGESLVVRSSQITKAIEQDSEFIFVAQNDIKLWPFKSRVQIDGEVMSYEGKQFVYYTYTETLDNSGMPTYSNEQKKFEILKSADDFKKFNEKTPFEYRHKNHYTGGMKIVSRADWNSEKRSHPIDTAGWSTKMETSGKKTPETQEAPRGFIHNKRESTVTIETPKKMKDESDTFWAFRGGAAQSSYKSYGTRFMFAKDNSFSTQITGIAFQLSGAREAGYYVEVHTSSKLSGKKRATQNEVSIISRSGGKDTEIARGTATAIGIGIWYDMDVYVSGSGNNQNISVFINGQKVAGGTTKAATAQPESGRFALFAKGKTKAEFEYFYAIARSVREPEEDYGFFDLKYGGIRGGQWEREYVWEMRTRRIKIKRKPDKTEQYRHNQYVFDEFGPYLHEVREFDVTFDPTPVRYSYLFSTNEWYAAVPEYRANPFGATFTIANTGRIHAVMHGEDKLVYAGAGSAVNQVCTVLGQDLEIADEESIKKENLSAIRSRGAIESELASEWIQSESMAETLATWMARHWSDSVDEVQVEVLGNPLIEIGDIVDVNYTRQNATPATHKYFVVGTGSSFESGITTTLNLRRRRTATDVS